MPARPLRGGRFLLAGLILLMLLFPAVQEAVRPVLLTAAVATVLVAGVGAVRSGRRHVLTAVVLGVVQIAFTVVSESRESTAASGVAFAITAVLFVYCIFCVLRYVLKSRNITVDQICAGISVYLMLGFAFGCMYYVLSIRNPGCFAVNSTKLEEAGIPDLMYFSFVTLATLGYGDITPVARVARTSAEFEALAGTMYMAVFMARLVSSLRSGHQEPEIANNTDGQ
jgi:hypothetical protein